MENIGGKYLWLLLTDEVVPVKVVRISTRSTQRQGVKCNSGWRQGFGFSPGGKRYVLVCFVSMISIVFQARETSLSFLEISELIKIRERNIEMEISL